jgi:hypothetical protein
MRTNGVIKRGWRGAGYLRIRRTNCIRTFVALIKYCDATRIRRTLHDRDSPLRARVSCILRIFLLALVSSRFVMSDSPDRHYHGRPSYFTVILTNKRLATKLLARQPVSGT